MKNRMPRAIAPLAALLLTAPILASADPPARVEICHVPPGDPDAAQTITVSEKAVTAHLAHGDSSLACGDMCSNDAGACDDANACTDDLCTGGQCANEPISLEACDDDDTLTADGCEPATGCVNFCLPLPNQEPCGFANGTFTIWDAYSETCEDLVTVQVSIKFEANILSEDDIDDIATVEQRLADAAPAFINEVQAVFASFTPSLTLACGDVAALEPDGTLSWLGQLFSVDLVVAIKSSALPPGATESTVVAKIQSEFASNPSLFDALEQRLTDLVGPTISYITVNVY